MLSIFSDNFVQHFSNTLLPFICVRRFNATQLPVKHAVSEEFGIFNKYYSSVPSASYPNHLFAQSATSCGVHDNLLFNECGGNTVQYPQMTVFDSLALHNVSFGLYVNSTCGVDGIPCGTQPVFFRNITAGLDQGETDRGFRGLT